MARLLLALPWADFPDSLNALGIFVTQVQSAIAIAIAHPLWATASIILAIGLLQITVDLLKRALKASLTFALKLPLNLSQWLWKRATASAAEPREVHLNQLLVRLEALRQEQDQVMMQIKALILAERPSTAEKISPIPGQNEATQPKVQSSVDTAGLTQ
ncbi:MAG: hypothetical protein HC800_11835 [Phormidesmis sp. RL_2_1]|nr:hypothetical protein [Phormidesmis sp. RL_2_1]